MRGGNLGFVQPDGTTSEPGLKVGPEPPKAAQLVKDAEIVPHPVQDGDRRAIVWRRQQHEGDRSAGGDGDGSIRQICCTSAPTPKHEGDARRGCRRAPRDHHPEMLDLFDVAGSGELSPARRPGATAPAGRRVVANPVPAPGTNR